MMEGMQLSYAFIGGIGLPELLIVLFLALLIFGGKKLPEVARSMGQAMRAFKDEAHKLKSEVELEAEKEEPKEAVSAAGPGEPQKASAGEQAPVDQKG